MDNTEDEAMTRFFGFTQDDLRTRVPVLSDLERRAYQAAWRIDREPIGDSVMNLCSKSTRHSRYIDHLARIIQEEMGR